MLRADKIGHGIAMNIGAAALIIKGLLASIDRSFIKLCAPVCWNVPNSALRLAIGLCTADTDVL